MLVHCYFITIELLYFFCTLQPALLTPGEPAATVRKLRLSVVAVAPQFLAEDEKRLNALTYLQSVDLILGGRHPDEGKQNGSNLYHWQIGKRNCNLILIWEKKKPEKSISSEGTLKCNTDSLAHHCLELPDIHRQWVAWIKCTGYGRNDQENTKTSQK